MQYYSYWYLCQATETNDAQNYFEIVKKLIREREKQISETLMSGALESIEHYKFLQGELNALYYIEGELKELNKEK